MRLQRAVSGIIAAVVLAGPADAAVRQAPVRGRVVNESGYGVPDVAVRLLQSRRDFKLSDWEFEEEVVSVLLGRTDEGGFFDLVADPDPDYRYFWLRFYDPKTFDGVRYQLPEDRAITQHLRKGRPVTVTVILLDHPDWAQVAGWIERLGADSPRAQLVRQLGIPDRRDEADGVERFWYVRNETVYRFRDGKFIGEERWEPPRPESARTAADS